MVTLQNISFRLMKPAKDLADWSFPLSQILEEYYALLEEPCSVNFGEAALVLQNSANVYVHRIECLFGETERFRQSFVGYGKEEETKAAPQVKKKNASRGYVNFEDFGPIDFEKDVGKNIDSKKGHGRQRRIKLLSRRFTQLENSASEIRVPIQVYDVYGEVMGKKYDFRCNRDTNANGALVDELTPSDFTYTRGSSIKERRNPSLTSSETCTQRTGTSGYHSGASPYQCSGTADVYAEDFDNDRENEICNDYEAPFVDYNTSCEGSGPDRTTEKPAPEKASKLPEKSQDAPKKPEVQVRRSERTKKAIEEVEGIDEELWRPIPLTRGTKNTRSEYSSPLKLPSYISLLEKDLEPLRSPSSKRKVEPRIEKHECLARFVLRELSSPEKIIHAPTDSTFKPLRKQELEDFQRSFDECFGSRTESVSSASTEQVGPVDDERDASPSPTFFEPEIEDSLAASPNAEWLDAGISCSLPRYRTLIENRVREILEKSEAGTELEHAVARWHESLQAKLTEAERRSTFRIHDYASRILGDLEALEQRSVAFDSVVRGKPACEVARYFLASLQLANTYNVQINVSESSSIEIVLLNEQRTERGSQRGGTQRGGTQLACKDAE